MKQKKNFLFILFLIMAILTLGSCGGKECKHEWVNSRVLVNATCTSNGVEELKCSKCDNTKNVDIDALGHDLQDVSAKSATCVSEGYDAYKQCSRCEYNTKGTIIPALNHSFNEEWKFDDNNHWHECLRNDCIETKDEEAHQDDDNDHLCDTCSKRITECSGGVATCTSKAVCSLCNHEYGEKDLNNHLEEGHIEWIVEEDGHSQKWSCCKTGVTEKTSHTFSEQVTDNKYLASAATCTNSSTYYYSCECGKAGTLTFSYGNTLEHKFGEWNEGKAATCTVDGIIPHKECSVCTKKFDNNNVEIKDIIIPASHDFDTDSWMFDENGHYHTCKRDGCDQKGSNASHNYVDGICDICSVHNTFGTEGLSYKYDETTKTYKTTGYTGETLDVVIPYFYNDGTNGEHKVDIIGDHTFYNGSTSSYKTYSNNNKITSIIIPDSIQTIELSAFAGCKSLPSVVIPNSVKRIEDSAFFNCVILSDITLSDSLEFVGPSIFSTTAWFNSQPDGIVYIDNYLYKYKGTLPDGEEVIIKDGVKAIFADAFVYSKLTKIKIPNSVNWIGERAFYNSNIKSLELGTGVKTIYYRAFASCQVLESITIPANVEFVASSAFGWCYVVKEITIESAKTEFVEYTFQYCGTKLPETEILKINLPEGLTSISKGMFAYSAISIIEIPASVEKIGVNAFYRCDRLTSFTVPSTIKVIGDSAFSYCSNMTSVTFPWTLDVIKTKSENINTDHWFENMNDDFIIYYEGGSFVPYHAKVEETCTEDGVKEYWEEILTNVAYSNDGYYNKLDTIVIPASCKGGTATCESKVVCDVCGNEYGEPLGHDPTNWKYDKDLHWKDCYRTDCNSKINEGEHNFVNGICSICKGYNTFGTEGLVFEYSLGTGVCRVSGYTGTEKNVVIPEYFKDERDWNYKVTYIGHHAFEDNKVIESVYIPSTVTAIYMEAFNKCTNLKEINIPSSVTEISSRCFDECNSLTKVNIESIDTWLTYTFLSNTCNPLYYAKHLYVNGTLLTDLVIPEGVTKINAHSFVNVVDITSITLPSSLLQIGSSAFNGCTGLERVNVEDISDWLNILFNDRTSNPLYYAKHLYIDGSLLTDLVIPEGTINLQKYAFVNCVDLKSVVIPNSVTSNLYSQFSGCYNIEIMTLPNPGYEYSNSVDTFGDYFGGYEYENSVEITQDNGGVTYYLPAALKTVHVTGEKILRNAFENCYTITTITFDNVKSIGDNAFNGCSNLYSITLPNTLESIGDDAFEYCHRLVEIYNKSSFTLTPGSFDYGSVALRAIRIVNDDSSSKVTTDDNGFAYYTDTNGVGLIGYVGTELHLTLPEGIDYIHKYALYEYDFLSVTVSEGVKSIGSNAFGYCTQLSQINLPDSLEKIESSVFYGTSNLSYIVLPKNLKTIEAAAFYSAIKMVEIVNLSSISIELGKDNNGGLAENALSVVTSLSESKISVTDDGFILYSTGDEVIVTGYIGKATDIVIPSNVTSIYEHAFYKNKFITSVEFPSNVKTIGNSSFRACENLKKVVFNEGLEKIESYAFYENKALTEGIVIPGSLNTIGYQAFARSSIKSLVILDGIETLGESAFNFCSSIKTLTIAKSVKTINDSCFRFLLALKEIIYEGTVEEWNSINKGTLLTDLEDGVLIKCTDNTIDFEGNIITVSE